MIAAIAQSPSVSGAHAGHTPMRAGRGDNAPLIKRFLQGRAAVARMAHNHEADGSNPSPATNFGASRSERAAWKSRRATALRGSPPRAAGTLLPPRAGVAPGHARKLFIRVVHLYLPAASFRTRIVAARLYGVGLARSQSDRAPPRIRDAQRHIEVGEAALTQRVGRDLFPVAQRRAADRAAAEPLQKLSFVTNHRISSANRASKRGPSLHVVDRDRMERVGDVGKTFAELRKVTHERER